VGGEKERERERQSRDRERERENRVSCDTASELASCHCCYILLMKLSYKTSQIQEVEKWSQIHDGRAAKSSTKDKSERVR
jgi:hypothetical protein